MEKNLKSRDERALEEYERTKKVKQQKGKQGEIIYVDFVARKRRYEKTKK